VRRLKTANSQVTWLIEWLDFLCFFNFSVSLRIETVLFLSIAPSHGSVVNKDKISSSGDDAVIHKYLQAALVADENVAAKHGNHTADFLLLLGNIGSGAVITAKFLCHIFRQMFGSATKNCECSGT